MILYISFAEHSRKGIPKDPGAGHRSGGMESMDTSDPLDGGGGGELLRRQFQVMYTGSFRECTHAVPGNVHRS